MTTSGCPETRRPEPDRSFPGSARQWQTEGVRTEGVRTAEPSDLRTQISRASRPVVARLQAMPRPAFMLIWLVLVAVSVFSPPAAAVPAVVIMLLAVGWLSFLSWPMLSLGGRVLRVAVLIFLIAAAVARFS